MTTSTKNIAVAKESTVLPLHNLVVKLRQQGFVIRPEDYIELLKVVETFGGEGEDERIEAAHLCPLIATSPEEQERFYKVFAEYKREPVIPPLPSPIIRNRLDKIIGWISKNRMWILIPLTLAIALIALRLLTAKSLLNTTGNVVYYKANIKDTTLRVGDSITLDATPILPSSVVNDTAIQFHWNTGDGFSVGKSTATTVLTKEGTTTFQLKLRSDKYNIYDSIKSITLSVCPAAPQVQFEGLQDNYSIGDELRLHPIIQGAFYRVGWKVNDSLVQPATDLSLRYRFGAIGEYEVEFFGLLSSDDNENSPCIHHRRFDKIVITDNQYTMLSSNRGKKLNTSSDVSLKPALYWLLLLPALLIGLGTWLWRKRKRKEANKNKGDTTPQKTDGRKPPYETPFENKDLKLTEPESRFRQVYQSFRQKAEDELTAFNVPESIRQTIRTGGLPELVFTHKLRYTDYLVLIDGTIAKSMQVRLFDYLVNRFNEEAINVERFYYTGKFEKIYNEDAPDGYSLKRLSELYKTHTLIIMGKAHQVVYDAYPVLDKQLSDTLLEWEYKAILTPIPYKDWGEKEGLLAEKFILLPADLDGQLRLIQAIREKNLDHKKYLSSFASFYETEFCDFSRIGDLKDYLQDDVLVQWLCATAVYHNLRWEVLIEMGKAICTQHGQPEKMNFTALLKLARIKWMNDGSFPAALRLELLKELTPENEAIARETLLQMLQYADTYFGQDHFFQEEKELQQVTSRFLLYAYDPVRFSTYASSQEVFKTLWDEGKLWDAPQKNYLENPLDRWSTLLKWKGASTGVNRFFELKNFENRRAVKRTVVANTVVASLLVILLGVLYLLKDRLPPNSFLINSVQHNANLFVQVVYNDSCGGSNQLQNYSGRLQLSNGSAMDLSFNNGIATVPISSNFIGDKSLLEIEWNNGQPISVTSFATLSTDTVQAVVSACRPTPVYNVSIAYDDSSRRQDVYTLASYLKQQSFSILDYTLSKAGDTTTMVRYFDDADKSGADSLARYLSLAFGNTYANTKVTKATSTSAARKKVLELQIHFTRTADSVSRVPFDSRLNEIWHGGTSNRLITFNYPSIYYSTGDKKTFGTYRITDVWKMKGNVFKIITQAYPQYAVFFIRNVQPNSFELSFCQNRYATIEEAQAITESNCDHFNTMTPYYEVDNNKAFLPLLAGKALESSNAAKLQAMSQKNTSASKSVGRLYYNNRFKWQAPKNLRFDIEQTLPIANATPFDRSYLQYPFPSTKTQTEDICKITYNGLDDTWKLSSSSLICRLNLSGRGYTSVPSEVYNMPNLKWLDLRKNKIDVAEIQKFRLAKPSVTVLYDEVSVESTPERRLAGITFDAKYALEGTSQETLRQILSYANEHTNASVRVVIYLYYTKDDNTRADAERKNIVSFLQGVYRLNYHPSQWKFETKFSESEQQQNQQSYSNDPYSSRVTTADVYGTNFPANFLRGNSKAE